MSRDRLAEYSETEFPLSSEGMRDRKVELCFNHWLALPSCMCDRNLKCVLRLSKLNSNRGRGKIAGTETVEWYGLRRPSYQGPTLRQYDGLRTYDSSPEDIYR
jgi:hypothetical protein